MRAREHGTIIDRWSNPLSPTVHVGLALMYTTAPRLDTAYEQAHTCLARYFTDAIAPLHSD